VHFSRQHQQQQRIAMFCDTAKHIGVDAIMKKIAPDKLESTSRKRVYMLASMTEPSSKECLDLLSYIDIPPCGRITKNLSGMLLILLVRNAVKASAEKHGTKQTCEAVGCDKPNDGPVLEAFFMVQPSARQFLVDSGITIDYEVSIIAYCGAPKCAKTIKNGWRQTLRDKGASPARAPSMAGRPYVPGSAVKPFREYGVCANCYTVTEKNCGRCHSRFFCSKECQTEKWGEHKPSCKKPE
jgi:hypothetical protein